MPTQRQLLRDAVEASLNGAGKPDGLTIARARRAPSADEELPLMMFVIGKEVIKRASDSPKSPVVHRGIKIGLDCWVTGEDGTLQDLLEPLLAWGTAALVGPPLDGFGRDVSEDEIVWDVDALEHSFGRATQWFTVWYTTNSKNQESKQ